MPRTSGHGVACPACGRTMTEVRDSRTFGGNIGVRRRRCCIGCEHRFTTVEVSVSEGDGVVIVPGSGARPGRTVPLATFLRLMSEAVTAEMHEVVRLAARRVGVAE